MSIRMFTVECPVHGIMEVTPEDRDSDCPTLCFIPINGKPCAERLKRIYDTPAVHYKGTGWAGKDK